MGLINRLEMVNKKGDEVSETGVGEKSCFFIQDQIQVCFFPLQCLFVSAEGKDEDYLGFIIGIDVFV